MNSVDLFTGIGGFALALQGIARPIMYCDKDVRARSTLTKLIAARRLPCAPIVNDVRDACSICAAVGSRRVDIVTCSVPCTGFSKRGHRRGLADTERSGLFPPTIKVIQMLRPKLVMFENVAEITALNQAADFVEITRAIVSAGYRDVRWTQVSARDMGAPHLRKRWFCLCVRRGASDFPKLPEPHLGPDWWRVEPSPPLTGPREDVSTPLFQLGNALVPQAAREAFYRLFTGFQGGLVFQLKCASQDGKTTIALPCKIPAHACLGDDGEIVPCTPPRAPSTGSRTKIVIDPKHFETRRVYRENGARPRRSPLVQTPRVLQSWPTPRTGGITHSANLSERTTRDLATVAMFCAEWNGTRMCPTTDDHRMSLDFVTWLMGFPNQYLRFGGNNAAN